MYYIRAFSRELEHEGDQEREQALAGHFGFEAKDVTRRRYRAILLIHDSSSMCRLAPGERSRSRVIEKSKRDRSIVLEISDVNLNEPQICHISPKREWHAG